MSYFEQVRKQKIEEHQHVQDAAMLQKILVDHLEYLYVKYGKILALDQTKSVD